MTGLTKDNQNEYFYVTNLEKVMDKELVEIFIHRNLYLKLTKLDDNKVAMVYSNRDIDVFEFVGYLPERLAYIISPMLDKDFDYSCFVNDIIYRNDNKTEILVEMHLAPKSNSNYSPENYYHTLDEDEKQDFDDWMEYVDNHN